jgi:hypothetical protein
MRTSKYIPVKISNKRRKQLKAEGPGILFFRTDENGEHWVKAAMQHGAIIMASYGHSAI